MIINVTDLSMHTMYLFGQRKWTTVLDVFLVRQLTTEERYLVPFVLAHWYGLPDMLRQFWKFYPY